MSFHEVSFPLEMVYGSSGGPGYQTAVSQLLSGATERVSRWEGPLHVFDARQAVRSAEDMAVLKDFFIARRGALHGFRLKDPGDFSTGPEGRGTPSSDDTLIGYGDGAKTSFQLVKRYNPGSDYEWVRTINKPIAGSALVEVGGTPVGGFALDSTTGTIALSNPPGIGVAVRAGFRFDVPVIFTPEADRFLSMNYAAFNDHRVQIPMVEDRGDSQSPSGFLYGNASWANSPAADVFVSPLVARLWGFSGSPANGAGWRLPDAQGLLLGGPHVVLANQTNGAVSVRDFAGTLLTQVPAQTVFSAYLYQSPGGAKLWLLAR